MVVASDRVLVNIEDLFYGFFQELETRSHFMHAQWLVISIVIFYGHKHLYIKTRRMGGNRS